MNTELFDSERLDLPSCSDARARRMCGGRHRLIKHLQRTGQLQPKATSPEATIGNNIHAAWAGQPIELSSFESDTLEKIKRLEQMLLTDWAAGREVALFAREQRLWLHHGITPLHSGQYDVAYVTLDFRSMLIIDAKTLMHPVQPADTNDQLRELVALAHFNYPAIRTFTAAIIQPHVERPASVAVYDELECELALRLLRWHLNDIESLDLPRVYGDWCRYCPASAFCPEARSGIEPILAYQFERDSQNKLTLPIGADGAVFLRRLQAARHLCETLQEAYKAFLTENPDDLPGWHLKPGKSKRSVSDLRAAFDALDGLIDLNAFLACSSVSVTKLQEAVGKAMGLKGKPLRDAFNARLADVIEFKSDAPSLEDTQE